MILSNAFRERAYKIWEENGRPDGREIEHWLQAEAELRAQFHQREDDDHRGDDVRAALRDEARGLVVDERAVLDGTHAVFDAESD